MRRILLKELGMTPYKTQLTIQCVFALLSGPVINLQKMPFLAKKIILSDEAHFDLGGYVNKQNCRIWGTVNPHAYMFCALFLKIALSVAELMSFDHLGAAI